MTYDSEPYYDGVWRDLHTGVDVATMDDMSPAFDQPGIPRDRPIDTRLEGPWGAPWWDGLEDPFNTTEFLPQSPNPLPWSPSEGTAATGAKPGIGAYEGAFRTRGAIQSWSMETGGGLWAEQWVPRIMRFPANIPERYDEFGVFNTDIKDDLAASIANQDQLYQTDTTITTGLLQWPNVWGRW